MNVSPSSFSLRDRIKIGVATLGGLGFVPKMPGTVGSFAALLPVIIASSVAGFGAVALEAALMVGIITSLMLGLWSVPLMEEHWGDDPGCVVIDEALGMWIVLLFVVATPIFSQAMPQLLIWMAIGFALFRLFDIAKPFPISRLNEGKGAFFVMIDDVVAGIYASGGLFSLWLMYQQFGKQILLGK